MENHIITAKKWLESAKEALPYFDIIPEDVRLTDIDFEFEAPHGGKCRGFMLVDGHRYHLCDICDLFPPFADVRKWLETITEINSINRFNSAILTIDCSGYITTITIHQVEWRELPSSSNRSVPLPVSILMVWRKGCRHDDRFVCFCDTNRTVKNFYHSLMDVLKRHSSLFNSEKHWHAVRGRGIMVSEKYRAQLFLKRIEYL